MQTQPKTFHITTYGCQMNFSDSEKIAAILHNAGLVQSKNKKTADVIILNTCSVRQSAEDRIFGLQKTILKLKTLRDQTLSAAKFRLPVTVITGCMIRRIWDKVAKQEQAAQQKYLQKLKAKLNWADIIIAKRNIAALPELLGLTNVQNKTAASQNYLSINPRYYSKFSAYIPISTGCNEFCSFCIVPLARGKLVNRPPALIINEAKSLVQNNYKNIILLGQNVNAWKNPKLSLVQGSLGLRSQTRTEQVGEVCTLEPLNPKLDEKPSLQQSAKIRSFLDLIKAIDNIKGDFWLSFLSSHPKYIDDDFISYFAKSANAAEERLRQGKRLSQGSHLRPYINLAMQSGSNKILSSMNRKYTIEQFIETCTKLKQKIPTLNLSTDIIVGFPGETEKDFAQTVNVMKKLKFDMAYINKFSPRQKTAAYKLEDNITWAAKKKRAKHLTKVLAKTALANNKRYLNRKVPVLIEKVVHSTKQSSAYGKTFNFKNIKVQIPKSAKIIKSDFITAKVIKATSWHLGGKVEEMDNSR